MNTNSIIIKLRSLCGIVAVTTALLSGIASAHHSFAAEFDIKKPVKLMGKVTQMRWSNPHAWLYLDITGADGQVVNWAFEMPAVNGLLRSGWRKEDLPIGTVLVVEGFQARTGLPVANASTITFPDGKRLFAGSPADSKP
jgi:hypothetical protein